MAGPLLLLVCIAVLGQGTWEKKTAVVGDRKGSNRSAPAPGFYSGFMTGQGKEGEVAWGKRGE